MNSFPSTESLIINIVRKKQPKTSHTLQVAPATLLHTGQHGNFSLFCNSTGQRCVHIKFTEGIHDRSGVKKMEIKLETEMAIASKVRLIKFEKRMPCYWH